MVDGKLSTLEASWVDSAAFRNKGQQLGSKESWRNAVLWFE
jgi:hypothetical protein